ncbi:hypothetical protein [Spiroplasma diminutum]|uniref:Uncharacterized protein n=1 Tax=Spiroplasma diminutum CUAS-1 TaxID=1276221 RepID=S5LZW3_9MOLU|nr:hypothetical protein [Spiroplasma diminutum]AGR42146.1 hypothetical protein SDIMI_v3c04420 [Spiroplasma diminutum CUAS-1]
MAGFAPKFCPTHLQIHVCDLQNVFNKNKSIEEELGAKVRRLHGTQTEEELAEENNKRKHQPGTLGDILAKAKEKIRNDKGDFEDSDPDNKIVSGEEINDRMAALRVKMMGGSSPSTSDSSPSNSDLSEIIQNAQNYQKENPEKPYIPPIRSNMDEKDDNSLSSSNPSNNLEPDDLNQAEIADESISKTIPKVKETKEKNIESSDKLFSQEETQELIQLAVKEALKQVGIIGDDEVKVKKTVKKKTS